MSVVLRVCDNTAGDCERSTACVRQYIGWLWAWYCVCLVTHGFTLYTCICVYNNAFANLIFHYVTIMRCAVFVNSFWRFRMDCTCRSQFRMDCTFMAQFRMDCTCMWQFRMDCTCMSQFRMDLRSCHNSAWTVRTCHTSTWTVRTSHNSAWTVRTSG